MRRLLIALAMMLLLASLATAQDFQKGEVAFERGDYVTALKEWRPFAEQGYAIAQNNLGVMYDQGQGVTQDYSEAVKWYRRAAEQGYAIAQYNLGVMYSRGHGFTQDYVQAHKWFNLAGAQGGEKAASNRDILAERMTPAQIAEAQKLAREWTPKHEE